TLLCGNDEAGKRGVAADACIALGLRLHIMRAADVPQSVAEREALARLWEREAVLLGSALLLDQGEQEMTHAAISFIESLRGMLFVSARETLKARERAAFRVDVHKPSPAEQQSLWMGALGSSASQLNGELEHLVSQFSLGTEGIHAASVQAREGLKRGGGDEALLGSALWDACRTLARPRLDDLAQRINPAASWDDLVLPEQQLRALRDIAAHVRQRAKVYETWGFASKGERGLGISALFAGASGTGKTMAAEVLAGDLHLDLYRIDLSQVVSKYIGETEKNLRRVFDAAEEGGAVLLFDEADALFGKRSEVKDSHDRYANIEVSYLLQRMEAYRGLAVLTTNLKSAVDTAFLRRLRFIVQFPFPDTAQRAEIWRRIFPENTPLANLDLSKLARLSIAGGNIRNVALHAAFLAADACEPVTMTHLLRAARSEYAKLEKPLTESEIGGWA
ncbi:MAG: ATP-binding protein, partial [Pyrinomonadaceae bacterium]